MIRISTALLLGFGLIAHGEKPLPQALRWQTAPSRSPERFNNATEAKQNKCELPRNMFENIRPQLQSHPPPQQQPKQSQPQNPSRPTRPSKPYTRSTAA